MATNTSSGKMIAEAAAREEAYLDELRQADANGQVAWWIPVSKIDLGARDRFDSRYTVEDSEFADFVESMRVGQKTPIDVHGQNDGSYLLIAGASRIAAAKFLHGEQAWPQVDEEGRPLILAHIRRGKFSEEERVEGMLRENIARRELYPAEIGLGCAELRAARAETIERLTAEKKRYEERGKHKVAQRIDIPAKHTMQSLANIFGKNKSTISRAMRLATLGPVVLRALQDASLWSYETGQILFEALRLDEDGKEHRIAALEAHIGNLKLDTDEDRLAAILDYANGASQSGKVTAPANDDTTPHASPAPAPAKPGGSETVAGNDPLFGDMPKKGRKLTNPQTSKVDGTVKADPKWVMLKLNREKNPDLVEDVVAFLDDKYPGWR